MLYYNEPYPDNRDPVSGDWTPASYSDIKRMREQAKSIASSENANAQMLNMLKSILK